MSRMSIFERLQPKVDLTNEYLKLDKVICTEKMGSESINDVFARNFRRWNYRGNYLSLQELRNELDLNISRYESPQGVVVKRINENDFLNFCELFINLREAFSNDLFLAKLSTKARIVLDTMQVDLEQLNFTINHLKENHNLIIELDPAATAASEIVESDLSDKIIEYNHYLLRGNLAKKREILRALSHKYDAIKLTLKGNNSGLEDKASFLLNNLNIRHNNKDKQSKDYRKFIADMSDADLEHWYDETYQTLLFALLSVDQVARNQAIDVLKTEISESK